MKLQWCNFVSCEYNSNLLESMCIAVFDNLDDSRDLKTVEKDLARWEMTWLACSYCLLNETSNLRLSCASILSLTHSVTPYCFPYYLTPGAQMKRRLRIPPSTSWTPSRRSWTSRLVALLIKQPVPNEMQGRRRKPSIGIRSRRGERMNWTNC